MVLGTPRVRALLALVALTSLVLATNPCLTQLDWQRSLVMRCEFEVPNASFMRQLVHQHLLDVVATSVHQGDDTSGQRHKHTQQHAPVGSCCANEEPCHMNHIRLQKDTANGSMNGILNHATATSQLSSTQEDSAEFWTRTKKPSVRRFSNTVPLCQSRSCSSKPVVLTWTRGSPEAASPWSVLSSANAPSSSVAVAILFSWVSHTSWAPTMTKSVPGLNATPA